MRTQITAAMLGAFMAAAAATTGTPSISLQTDIYAKDGPTNSFTIVLGAAPGNNGYVDIVCDNGNQSEAKIDVAYYDPESGAMIGTPVACQVGKDGWVKIYCDEGVVIDYLSITGAEITNIEFANPKAMEILALEHNALESLDLTEFTNLQMLSLNDNPFDKSPLVVGADKPNLVILEIAQVGNLDPDFDIAGYPQLRSFDAMNTTSLKKLTPSACPNLQKISVDNTSVAELDLRKNTELYILNISESRIAEVDLSACTKLQQFFATHESSFNSDVKLKSLDLTNNPDLIYLFINGNDLETLDISANPDLQDLYVRKNRLTSLDITENPNLYNVMISRNYMDFNTLPLIRDNWLDYDFGQYPIAVPKSYLVGSGLDLSPQVVINRPDVPNPEKYPTTCKVFRVDPENTGLEDPELDPSYYSMDRGIVTINKVVADSVYVVYYNQLYAEYPLRTTTFKVKDSSTYGQKELKLSIGNILSPGEPVQFRVGLDGATAERPVEFFVDFGDGKQQTFTATTWDVPEEANVVGTKAGSGDIKVYVAEDDVITALAIHDMYLTNLDLSAVPELRRLQLVGTELYSLDLQWNRCLQSLLLQGNHFGANFTLRERNGNYGKNVLSVIELPDNEMTAVELLPDPYAITHLDLSGNQLSEVALKDYDNLLYLDVSGNRLEQLVVNYCTQLATLNAADNMLETITLPETNVIERFDISGNQFTLATLPERWPSLVEYSYAPQAVMEIPSKGPGCNLDDQYVTVDGHSTVFTWKLTDGTVLTADEVDAENGVARFLAPIYGKQVYCELTNEAYPDFAGDNVLRTTAIEAAAMPTHVLGSFTTPKGGQTTWALFLSDKNNDALYIDWQGTATPEQCPMPVAGERYKFSSTTKAGATVTIYSYDEDAPITYASFQDFDMDNVDLSGFGHVTGVRMSNCGLGEKSVKAWPASTRMVDLMLENNNYTTFDLKPFQGITTVSLTGNYLQTVDLSALPGVEYAYVANNYLTSVKLDNPSLVSLDLSTNRLQDLDFAKIPAIYQLFINSNRFSEMDLDALYGLKDLHVLFVDDNLLDFSTLPVRQDNWTFYLYGNQPELQVTPAGGKVDLSKQAVRDGVDTEFTWFYGYPEIDEETGSISGTGLVENEDYTIEGGVTTFLRDFDKVCCVLTNALFPQTYLITNLFGVTAMGIEGVGAELDGREMWYTLQGTAVSGRDLAPGIYIRVAGGKATKVLVK